MESTHTPPRERVRSALGFRHLKFPAGIGRPAFASLCWLFAVVAPAHAATTWNVTVSGTSHPHAIVANDATLAIGGTNQIEMQALVADALTYLRGVGANDALTLYFPSGTYHFQHLGTTAIEISGTLPATASLRLTGAGVESTALVFHTVDQPGIVVKGPVSAHIRNVTVEEMHLTRMDEQMRVIGSSTIPPLNGIYTSQGTVIELGTTVTTSGTRDYVKVQIDEGFPHPSDLVKWENSTRHSIVLVPFQGDPLDPEASFVTPALMLDPEHPADDPSPTDSNVCTFYFDKDAYMADWPVSTIEQRWVVGQQRVALHSKLGSTTLRFHYADNCTAKNLLFTRHAANPFLISAASNACTVDHIDVERIIVGGTNMAYYSGPGGGCMTTAEITGHTIKNCIINNSADDAYGCYTFDSQAASSGWLVENNVARNSGRAVMIESSSNGIVRNNYFYRTSGGLVMGNFYSGSCSVALNNWHIEDNVFDQMRGGNSCISITGQPKNNHKDENGNYDIPGFSGTHNEIYFERNTFIKAPKKLCIFQIDFSDHIYLNNNVIEGFSTEDTMVNAPDTGSEALIYVEKGLHVTGTGNIMNEITTRPIAAVKGGPTNPSVATVSWGASQTFPSIGAEDGYVTSGTGASQNVGSTATSNLASNSGLQVGDTASNQVRRSIVSFNTGTLAATPTIVAAAIQLDFSRGTNATPWSSTLGACTVDIKNGSFNENSTLEKEDFQAVASGTQVAVLSDPGDLKCTRADLNAAGRSNINVSGTGRTQFRIAFPADPLANDGQNNWAAFYPGEYTTNDDRHWVPQLTVVTDNLPVFSGTAITKPNAIVGVAYSTSMAADATDPDGDTLTYTIVDGPTWLSCSTSGVLTGTPAASDVGLNSFLVRASDGKGLFSDVTVKIHVTPPTSTVTLTSLAADDGWIMQTASGTGGGNFSSSTTTAAAILTGDQATNRQYKSILSFNTGTLPAGATIVSATLKIQCGTIFNDPSNLGALYADLKGATGFSGSTALQSQDFEAGADLVQAVPMTKPAQIFDWSTGALSSAALAQINRAGTTQFRVYFQYPSDNDNVTDYFGFYSGDSSTPSKRPVLEITYY